MKQDNVVRVLGPIDVLTPSGPVSVGGRSVRALLGALAVGANHAVTIDHIFAVIWGDRPPSSAHPTLQSYVSKLRELLGADAIIRVDHSYQLVAGVDNIDATMFEQLLAEAVDSDPCPERRRTACREALELWRGQPFGDLAEEEGFRVEAYRLDELRLIVMELALGAELALGHHELVVAEIESAVEEHPYRERLWLLLIEALARCGRRVEALRAGARLRFELAGVGLEATDELETLEQCILAGRVPSTDRGAV
jgi:DNA-binding SARP family transcriptional activator